MTERKITQALGLQEDWYTFSLDNGELEIKVWHDLEGVASWKKGDYIECVGNDFIDYDELELTDDSSLEKKVIEIRNQGEIQHIEKNERKKKLNDLIKKWEIRREELKRNWKKEMTEFKEWLDKDESRGKGLITRNGHLYNNLEKFFSELLPEGRSYKMSDYWTVHEQWKSEKLQKQLEEQTQQQKQQLLNELEQLVAGTEKQLTTEEQMQLLNNLWEETLNEGDNNLEKAEEELTKSLTVQKKIEFTNLANKLETLQITSLEEAAVESKIEISPENQKR